MFNAILRFHPERDSETYKYTYNNNGERIRKVNADTDERDYYLRDYLGRELVIYDNLAGEPKSANIYGNGLVGMINISGTTDSRNYYLKDHLGNIRCVVSAEGIVQSAQDYYPYGELLREYNSNTQRFKFTSKERDAESGYDYSIDRYYHNDLGIWNSVERLENQYYGWSPYCYVLDNPMRYVDPQGTQHDDPNKPQPDFINTLNQLMFRMKMLIWGSSGNYPLSYSNDNESDNGDNADAVPYVGSGIDYLQYKVEKKMDEVIARKKFKSTKAKAAAKYNKYLKPIKVISTGLTFFEIVTSVNEGATTGDWSQTAIDLGIIGVGTVSGPFGLGLTVLDQTVGIKNMWNTNVKMEIERARRRLPSPMSYLP